jgi:hypothetical protein
VLEIKAMDSYIKRLVGPMVTIEVPNIFETSWLCQNFVNRHGRSSENVGSSEVSLLRPFFFINARNVEKLGISHEHALTTKPKESLSN